MSLMVGQRVNSHGLPGFSQLIVTPLGLPVNNVCLFYSDRLGGLLSNIRLLNASVCFCFQVDISSAPQQPIEVSLPLSDHNNQPSHWSKEGFHCMLFCTSW